MTNVLIDSQHISPMDNRTVQVAWKGFLKYNY